MISEQTAAEQRTRRRLNKPDWAVCLFFIDTSYGRGGGVGCDLGVGPGLDVGEGLGVEVAVGVGVEVAVAVGVGVGVGGS